MDMEMVFTLIFVGALLLAMGYYKFEEARKARVAARRAAVIERGTRMAELFANNPTHPVFGRRAQ